MSGRKLAVNERILYVKNNFFYGLFSSRHMTYGSESWVNQKKIRTRYKLQR
jgi:hypothetical protein